MSKLPLVTAKEFERILIQLGFTRVRQKGSHVFYRHADGRYTTVPHHKGRQISRSLLYRILNQIELTIDEFRDMLGK